MSIQDFIARKKQELFLARDSDKQELQRQMLMSKRKELEKEQQLRTDIRKEQAAIRELRSAPTREKLDAFRSGFKKLSSAAQRSQTSVAQLGKGQPSSPFKPDNSPFSQMGDAKPAKVAERKTKTIVIKLR